MPLPLFQSRFRRPGRTGVPANPHLSPLQENEAILRRYQTPGTTAETIYPSGVSNLDELVSPDVMPPGEPPENPHLGSPTNFNSKDPAAQGVMGALNKSSHAWVESRLGPWGGDKDQAAIDREGEAAPITSTDRFYARQAARTVSRQSSAYPVARQFLRIDGSAPHSPRDTMGSQGDQLRPPPFDFAGTQLGGKRAMGFEATPQDTAKDVRKDFSFASLHATYHLPRANPDEGGTVPNRF